MANTFLDRNMGQIIASTNEAISTIMSLRKLRWDYAIQKAQMNYKINREQDNRNWQMNLEMFREQKADERIKQQIQYNKEQSLINAKQNFEQQYNNITKMFGGNIEGLKEINDKVSQATSVDEVMKAYGEMNSLVTPQMIAKSYKSRFPQPRPEPTIKAGLLKALLVGTPLSTELQAMLDSMSDDKLVPLSMANRFFQYKQIAAQHLIDAQTKALDTASVLKNIQALEKAKDSVKGMFILGGGDKVAYQTYDSAYNALVDALDKYNKALAEGNDTAMKQWGRTILQLENANSELIKQAYTIGTQPESKTPNPSPKRHIVGKQYEVNPNSPSNPFGNIAAPINDEYDKMQEAKNKP